MDERISHLEVNVSADPDAPNSPSIQILVDGKELVSTDKFMGFDPEDLLTEESPLLATEEPRRIALYHCSCGEPGCGSVVPVIRRDGAIVTWSDFRDYVGVYTRPTDYPHPDESWGRPMNQSDLQFDPTQYEAAIRQASSDRSWETDDRKIARLVKEGLRYGAEELKKTDFELQWAFPGLDSTLEVAFQRGIDQVVTEHSTQKGNPEAVATRIVRELLDTSPRNWPIVTLCDNSKTLTSYLHLDPQDLRGRVWHRKPAPNTDE